MGSLVRARADREQVSALNSLVHQLRVTTGEAADAVVTAAGERIGVGDRIATRRNDAELDVANRETWTVTGSGPDGQLTVTGVAGTRRLPASYVHTCVELAHATTVYGGMTRGRDRADLGPAHAAMRAVDDIQRYGPKVPVRHRNVEPPLARRPEHALAAYRPPSSSPSRGIGF